MYITWYLRVSVSNSNPNKASPLVLLILEVTTRWLVRSAHKSQGGRGGSMVSELGSRITGPPPLEFDSKWGSWIVTRSRSVVSSGIAELTSH